MYVSNHQLTCNICTCKRVRSVHVCSIYQLSGKPRCSKASIQLRSSIECKNKKIGLQFDGDDCRHSNACFKFTLNVYFLNTFFDYFSHYFLAPCHVLHFSLFSYNYGGIATESVILNFIRVSKNACFQRICQYIHSFLSCYYFVCCIALLLISRYLTQSSFRSFSLFFFFFSFSIFLSFDRLSLDFTSPITIHSHAAAHYQQQTVQQIQNHMLVSRINSFAGCTNNAGKPPQNNTLESIKPTPTHTKINRMQTRSERRRKNSSNTQK